MILHDRKVVFIHVPKTGGSSMTQALLNINVNHTPYSKKEYGLTNSLKHATALTIQQHIGKKQWEMYYKFAFIRNSWDRIVSAYAWNQRSRNKYKLTTSFNDFIKTLPNIVSNPSHPMFRHCRPQIDFVASQNNKLIINDVFHYETILLDIITINSKIGTSLKLDKYKASNRKRYQDYYTLQTKNIVHKCYATEIKMFNYKF